MYISVPLSSNIGLCQWNVIFQNLSYVIKIYIGHVTVHANEMQIFSDTRSHQDDVFMTSRSGMLRCPLWLLPFPGLITDTEIERRATQHPGCAEYVATWELASILQDS